MSGNIGSSLILSMNYEIHNSITRSVSEGRKLIIFQRLISMPCFKHVYSFFLIYRAKEMQRNQFFNNIKENVQVIIMLNITFIGLSQGDSSHRSSPG